MFKVGDKVKIAYIRDCDPHNGEIGTLTWLHNYTEYNGVARNEKTQGIIKYKNGDEHIIDDVYRRESGLVSPVEKVDE